MESHIAQRVVGLVVKPSWKAAYALCVDLGVCFELLGVHLQLKSDPAYGGYLSADAIRVSARDVFDERRCCAS